MNDECFSLGQALGKKERAEWVSEKCCRFWVILLFAAPITILNTNYDFPRGIHYRLPHHFPITLAGSQKAAIYQLNVFPPLTQLQLLLLGAWWWHIVDVSGSHWKNVSLPATTFWWFGSGQRWSCGSAMTERHQRVRGGGGRDSNQTIRGGWQFRDGDN